MRGRRFGLVLALITAACGGEAGGTGVVGGGGTAGAPPLLDAAVEPDAAMDPVGCKAPAGAAPRTIAEVIALINALPKPVTIPCVLEALPGTREINAANSILSAQPAEGRRSPRIFVFFDPLILSVVPEGMGAHLLEFGERRSETHTLKGELEFPVDGELGPGAAYDQLRFDERNSTCGFCHAEEDPVPELEHPFARVSRAIRPMPSQRVTVAELQAELASCDADAEAERCAMLRSLVGPGRPALDREFPAEWKTFF